MIDNDTYPFNDERDREAFEELAGKLQFDGNLSQEEAERQAAESLGFANNTVMNEEYPAPEDRHPQPRENWRYHIISWTDLMALDITEEPEMLWDGFLPKDDIALLTGLKGRGKTTVTLQLSIALVRGDSTFLGRKLNPKYNRVLYVKFEGSGTRRIRKLMNRYGKAYPGLVFFSAPKFNPTEVAKAIEKLHSETPFDMVVIDCIGNIYRGDQNSNSDAQKFFRDFDTIAHETLLLFLHHLNKAAIGATPNEKFIQGAGAFAQRARTVLMLTDEALHHERYLHVAFEDDMSDEFKQNALILNFDTATKTYSSDGFSTRPVESINGTQQGAKNTVDWEGIFGNESELKRAEIVKRLKELAGIGERTADSRIKAELKLVRFGVYCLQNLASGEFASLQGTKGNANCKVGESLEIEDGELFDSSIQPNALSNLDGWTDESAQKSELPQPPEQQKPSKSKTPEPELRSFIKTGESLSPIELMQRSELSLTAFEKTEKREVKFGLLIRSGKGSTVMYTLPPKKPETDPIPTAMEE